MSSAPELSNSPGARRARERRVRRGVETERAAKAFTRRIALQSMIEQPLLEVLAELGGKARPKDVYAGVAERLNVDPELLDDVRVAGDGQHYNYFQQQIRWTRQTAVAKGLIAGERGTWELTDKAFEKLGRISGGQVVLVYSTGDGVAFWAHAEDAAARIEDGSVKLLLTSPPYPVVDRQYGRFTVPEWLDWMHRLMGIWKGLIDDDGTIAVNIMDCFVPGTPVLSPYVERFVLAAVDGAGLNLAGRFMWNSPTKLANIQWSVKERVYPRNALEHILLFSKSTRPAWNIDRMEKPEYSARQVVKTGKGIRPSGLDINEAAFRREDGRIPSNLITAGGASGSDRYSKRCREEGVEAHPARYPALLPRQIILMTTEPGDVVYDPMAGSNTTGQVASELGRRFISSEPMLPYALSSGYRFDGRPDFQWHLPQMQRAA